MPTQIFTILAYLEVIYIALSLLSMKHIQLYIKKLIKSHLLTRLKRFKKKYTPEASQTKFRVYI